MNRRSLLTGAAALGMAGTTGLARPAYSQAATRKLHVGEVVNYYRKAGAVEIRVLGRIVTYLKRLSTSAGTRDFEVMTMKDISKAKPDATQSADFGQWASDNDDVMG